MDIRNNLEGVRSPLEVNPTDPSVPQSKAATPAAPISFESDSTDVSSAGSEVSQAASGDGVRADKVAAVQAALAAGTYNVPASAVASKVIDSMLPDARSEGQSDS
jgi:flagellar biosynthesis anti-sigma factor FlgM